MSILELRSVNSALRKKHWFLLPAGKCTQKDVKNRLLDYVGEGKGGKMCITI